MKEHPLLMQGPLVRATLEGRKTQTRRPIKKEALPYTGYKWAECLCKEIDPSDTPCVTCAVRFPDIPEAGDRLWVRETYKWADAKDDGVNQSVVVAYRADDKTCEIECSLAVHDGVVCAIESEEVCGERWRPSIHMPRWACRLVLPLVSVRVERVQDITEADAKAEGVEPIGGSYREGFRAVWESIYGSWDLNPWIWVAEWDHIEVRK